MNLKDLHNKTIYLFGKPRAFNMEEFTSQLQSQDIRLSENLDKEVALLVEGRMMTPYEQNAADEEYEKAELQSISIDVLEEALAKSIDTDVLLMSLKLSHDKERLKAFIENEMLSDELFFKLMKMYSWKNEDFFENDENRDVSAAFISRFYINIERNHNVQYATTGFIHLVSQATSPKLLEEIYRLQPMQFHPKIEMAIAMSVHIDERLQESFYKNAEPHILEALSFNKKLKLSLVKELLKDEELHKNMARTLELNAELYELFKTQSRDLGLNESLTLEMQKNLLSLSDDEVYLSLAYNPDLNAEIINELLKSQNAAVKDVLYENAAMPRELLEEAYEEGKYHASLAKNEATPIEILYQLQLDSRYERSVKTNAAFGEHIQSENIGWL